MRKIKFVGNIGAVLLAGIMAVGLSACGQAAAAETGAKTKLQTTGSETGNTGTGSAGQAGTVKGSVTSSGSSALLPLAQIAAEEFMKKNPECSVAVNGGGSGTGLKQVSDGAVDIGNSDVFAEEKLDASTALGLKDHEVCTVTMAPVVNKSLGISSLTTQQLTDIFTGRLTNWKDAGGPDEEIMLVTRPASSGTRALFKKWALNGEEEASTSALETDDSGTLLQTVEDNAGAIGYVALPYLVNSSSVQAVAIDGVEPTLENTYSGAYKVWGFEHMYTRGEGSEAAQEFLVYMTGDSFAESIEKLGYGVASKMTDTARASHK